MDSCGALAPLLSSLVMVSVDLRAWWDLRSTFLVLLVLKMSHYLTESVAVLIAELLVCSHGGCPEPCSEMCRDLGEAKVQISRENES